MTEREALKLALEALERADKISGYPNNKKAITAIKEALAQPEPVIDKSAAVRIATALGWEPKRTWRWLTDEEIYEAWDTIIEEPKQAIEFAYNIQAKLKEKNT